jgi:hypothetical protein
MIHVMIYYVLSLGKQYTVKAQCNYQEIEIALVILTHLAVIVVVTKPNVIRVTGNVKEKN